jgi:hypothetical protein
MSWTLVGALVLCIFLLYTMLMIGIWLYSVAIRGHKFFDHKTKQFSAFVAKNVSGDFWKAFAYRNTLATVDYHFVQSDRQFAHPDLIIKSVVESLEKDEFRERVAHSDGGGYLGNYSVLRGNCSICGKSLPIEACYIAKFYCCVGCIKKTITQFCTIRILLVTEILGDPDAAHYVGRCIGGLSLPAHIYVSSVRASEYLANIQAFTPRRKYRLDIRLVEKRCDCCLFNCTSDTEMESMIEYNEELLKLCLTM